MNTNYPNMFDSFGESPEELIFDPDKEKWFYYSAPEGEKIYTGDGDGHLADELLYAEKLGNCFDFCDTEQGCSKAHFHPVRRDNHIVFLDYHLC